MKAEKIVYETPEFEVVLFSQTDVVLISVNKNSEDEAYKLKEYDWNDSNW